MSNNIREEMTEEWYLDYWSEESQCWLTIEKFQQRQLNWRFPMFACIKEGIPVRVVRAG